jgi:hypothetical protein
MSPAGIVTGAALPDYHSLRIKFGSFAQVMHVRQPTNSTAARLLGAIALTPTGNAAGDYNFMSLATGLLISPHEWTAAPIDAITIARVEALAAHQNQPLIQADGLVVEGQPELPLDDDEYDPNVVPAHLDDESLGEFFEVEDDFPLGPVDDDGLDPYPPVPDQRAHDDEPNQPVENQQDGENQDGEVPAVAAQDEGAQGAPIVQNQGAQELPAELPEEPELVEVETVEDKGAQETHSHNLRPRNRSNAQFVAAMDDPYSSTSYDPPAQLLQVNGRQNEEKARVPMTMDEKCHFIFAHILTQMSLKVGIQEHGQKAVQAMMNEFAQLEELDVFYAIDASTLTKEKKRQALRAINLLIKEKRDGKIKGQTVADDSVQHNLYDKSETVSPTVSPEALSLTIIPHHRRRRSRTEGCGNSRRCRSIPQGRHEGLHYHEVRGRFRRYTLRHQQIVRKIRDH